MIRHICAILLIGAAGCSARYVGPGSGTRDERVLEREQRKAESTEVVDPVRPVPVQKAIDNSAIPVAP